MALPIEQLYKARDFLKAKSLKLPLSAPRTVPSQNVKCTAMTCIWISILNTSANA